MFLSDASAWDLTALLNAANAKASLPERHLWLIRLLEWLRHGELSSSEDLSSTPTPILRLKHLLGVLERHPEHHARVGALLQMFWQSIDSAALLADFGFAPRMDLWGEIGRRLRARVLPPTPATNNLAELFGLLFPRAEDAVWLRALDDATLAKLGAYLYPTTVPEPQAKHAWKLPFLDAFMFLGSAVHAAAFSPALRERMSPELLSEAPFRQLARVAEQVRQHIENCSDEALLLQTVQYMRALLDTCRHCAQSVHAHLESHGVSVNVVFEVNQLLERTHRMDALLNCAISPAPGRDVVTLLVELVQTADERRSVRALLSRHYSLLARKVAERSAETGEQYITRNRHEYRRMLRAAWGGGAVLAGTTLMKFALTALGLSAFWDGFWAGVNYATSFVLVQLMHFTVATKQPAMTAPAIAAKLQDLSHDESIENFVDEVAHLIRSQAAGVLGNVTMVIPLVLAAQWGAQAVWGAPLIGHEPATHVLKSLTLLGPTAFFAAFTGVLLFASSLIAGWVENWFVWHRLDSAIAWNPRIIARLGAARAARWAVFWRKHISGFASSISLGFMLGLVPAIAAFLGLPIEVRHVTLATGQLAAAVGSEGVDLLLQSSFWWCVAGIAAIGTLNVSVSFFLAFRVALRSQGIRLGDRSRIYRALRARLWRAPLSFLWPKAE